MYILTKSASNFEIKLLSLRIDRKARTPKEESSHRQRNISCECQDAFCPMSIFYRLLSKRSNFHVKHLWVASIVLDILQTGQNWCLQISRTLLKHLYLYGILLTFVLKIVRNQGAIKK